MSAAGHTQQGPSGIVARLAAMTTHHRRWVMIGWIVTFIGVLAISGAVGTKYSTNFTLPGTDTQRAFDLLAKSFPAQSGDIDQIVFSVKSGSLKDPATQTQLQAMFAAVRKLPHVSDVISPFGAGPSKAISKSGQIGFATLNLDQRANIVPIPDVQNIVKVATHYATPNLQIALGGEAIENIQQPKLGAATAVGLLAAIIVLLITFGSFVAMGLPIVTALLGLGTGIGLAGLASHLTMMPNFSTEVAAMIGLGVGIDYALFIVTRFRDNFIATGDVDGSVIAAMDTAGRAVLFAGATVIIALLGQFALGVSFLGGLAIASTLAVLMTMVAALTVLPAFLSRFGQRIGTKRVGRRGPATAAGDGGFWARWGVLIERNPWPAAVSGLAIMLVLAAPVLSLRLGNSDEGNDASGQTTRISYDLLAKGFGPGVNGPLQVVVSTPHAGDSASLATIASALRATADVVSVSAPHLSPSGTIAVFNVFPASSPQALATTNLVSSLRGTILPPVEAQTDTKILVGGQNAGAIDFTHVLSSKLPLFIGIVVLLSALLLLIVFRSLLIPIQAAVMNLLSIGASLGVVVAVFQWGWGGSLLDVKGAPIEAFMPVMLFAIVFGLSMDYEVFLVSRIHEEWTRTKDAHVAVTQAVATTGRVITAAATIMICVFLSFVFGGTRILELFGMSLATAVFLDAFVVRSLLLPSVLHLLGEATWALPSWLEQRLPHIAIERDGGRPVAEPALEDALA